MRELLAEAKDAATLESYEEVLDEVQTNITRVDVPVIAVAQPKWSTVLQLNIETIAWPLDLLGTEEHALFRRLTPFAVYVALGHCSSFKSN